MKVTLDNNCIIALEQNEINAFYIKKLIIMHDRGNINLRVVGIGASERKQGGVYASSFSEFKEKIATVGLEKAEILPPIAYWDITFWDNCIYPDGEAVHLEREIHKVLFPDIDFDYQVFCQKRGLDLFNSGKMGQNWRNKKCDVLTMWCHITYKGDIFVSNDNHFLKTKKHKLIALGAGDILTPQEAQVKLEAIQA